MKSDHSIKNIAIASIKRHSIGLEEWTMTKIAPEIVPFDINFKPQEQAVVLLYRDEENWTLITTQRIMGSIGDVFREAVFPEIADIIFGQFKIAKFGTTDFSTIDIYGNEKKFLMETGKPSMAYMYAIRIIDNAYKNNSRK